VDFARKTGIIIVQDTQAGAQRAPGIPYPAAPAAAQNESGGKTMPLINTTEMFKKAYAQGYA
jgi:hypothetical protein